MSWDIRVWHEGDEGRARLNIEAGIDVPDDVISDLAAAYWYHEVQADQDWEGSEPYEGGTGGTGQRLQG